MTSLEITVPQELSDIDKLIYLVRVSDKADQLTREGLHKVFEEKGWKNRFSSWGEFVSSTEGLGKSETWASKHLSIYEHFTLNGGISQEKLIGIPTESLYIASQLGGTPEEQVSKAKTLSRSDLREEKVADGHVHSGETYQIHKCCGKRV